MWESGDDELPALSPRAVRSFMERALYGEESLLFDLKTKSLRPLCRVEATEEAVTVTFDLPYVDKKDIALTSTESSLSVEAETKRPVTVRVGGSVQKHVIFEKYTGNVQLPARVNPAMAKATFRNGLLRVKFPVAKKGSRVKVR